MLSRILSWLSQKRRAFSLDEVKNSGGGRNAFCMEYHCSTKSAVFIVYSPVSYEPLNSTCAKRYVRSLNRTISSSRWRARERRGCLGVGTGGPPFLPKLPCPRLEQA